ncbi:alpha/beta-hydrolase [Xylaria sp. CBS 124048]|nr:alpha/beta-hydrolase [Xylaria sp. CBS 124048]
MASSLNLFGTKRGVILVAALLCVSAGLGWQSSTRRRKHYLPSPAKTGTHGDLPYPPQDALPGGRDVETPYGSIRVYEWGPEDGERVLFVHGITTPAVALGEMARAMAARGYRVMMFDLFGRGYSDAPSDLTYDTRLYVSQILLVLASSPISWTKFRLIGYSFGGGVCVAFTRYFPHLVRSVCLTAPGGLIRRHHIGFWSWLYHNSGLLPESLVKYLVRRRIRPDPEPVRVTAGSEKPINGDRDPNGGPQFNCASVSKASKVTVSEVVTWQVDNHEGFVMAFLSSIRNGPVYARQTREDFECLSEILKRRRSGSMSDDNEASGKVLLVLGKDDGLIIRDECIEDAYAALGKDGVEVTIFDGGHEFPISAGAAVASSIDKTWRLEKLK